MLFSLAGPSFFLSDDYSYTFQGHLSLSSCHFFIHLIVYLLGFLILVLLPPPFKKCFSSFSFVLCHFNFSFLGVSFTFSTGPPTLVSFSWFLISYFFPLQLSVLLYYFGLCVNFSFVSFSWFTFFFCRGGFFHFLSSDHPFFWHSFSCIQKFGLLALGSVYWPFTEHTPLLILCGLALGVAGSCEMQLVDLNQLISHCPHRARECGRPPCSVLRHPLAP